MNDGPIAIVGAACRFPGAPDLAAFWELLSSATDAVSEVGSERWSKRFFFHPTRSEPGKSYTWAAGLIAGVDLFEPAFFGISPREAAQMDPQQRLLLELVWHAIEDAGIPTSKLAGTATGVYIGASTTDYGDLRIGDPASGDSYSLIGGTLSILANRISYICDLRGPSLTVDTACSSSLVALHHACEALRSERIESAIVGGVNLLLSPYPFLGFCRATMLSRQGRCFAFDARADGYVRAEGGAVVLLKPLARALADGDSIRAVINSTGVNSDGRTIGLSLPSAAAQATLLQAVYDRAGIDANDLRFFEMHGTGTPAGDPIEAHAVGRALGSRRAEKLPIGSVKTNIGHLEAASGMAGLIKAALALEHGIVPPSLHCETPNPNIPFDDLNLRLVSEAETITPGGAALAGVNSFGFGGTNAHVVLAAPPARPVRAEECAAPPPLLLSARSEGALRELAQCWRDMLAQAAPEESADWLRAAARCRDQHPQRLVAFGASPSDTADTLAAFLEDPRSPAVITGGAVRDGVLAFAFSGNGAQWVGMGREAYRHNATFRVAVEEVDAALRPALGWSLAERFEQGLDATQLARADIAQPLLFASQVGSVAALRALGIEAAAHIGHSVGEIAAAWAAGALPLAVAAQVVAARSRRQEHTRGAGRMGALALGEAAAQRLIDELGSALEIAALNTAQSVTVSGPGGEIDRLGAEARRRGVAFRALDLDFAFHSRAMDPIRDELRRDLAGIASCQPRVRLVSTVTGDFITDERLDAEYWWHNIRRPVRFAEAAARLVEAGCNIFIEIGPTPLLQAYLNDALRSADKQGRVLASLTRRDDAVDPFPAIAATCHVAGCDITANHWFDGPAKPRGLPLYPWQRERFWFQNTVEAKDRVNPVFEHPLLGFREDGAAPAWLNHLDQDVLPWIGDHAVENVPVLPASAVIEMALAAARAQRPQAHSLELLDVELRRPLPFDKGRMRELRTSVSPETGDWELASRPRLSNEPLTAHAVARLSSAAAGPAEPLAAACRPVVREIDAAAHYRLAAGLGLNYGARFRTVERIETLGSDEVVVHLDPSVIDEPLAAYLIHPALLDGALQGLLGLLADQDGELAGTSFLPWRFGRVRLIPPFGRVPRRARLRLTRVGIRSAAADIALFDEQGLVLADLAECWFRRVELTRRGSVDERSLRLELVPTPLAEEEVPESLAAVAKVGLLRSRGADSDPPAQGEQPLLLAALVATIADRAMRARVDTQAPFTVEGLIDSGRIDPDSAALATQLLVVLESVGAAIRDEAGWRLAADHDLPDTAELWRLLLAEAPLLVAELSLAAASAEDLPAILRDGPRSAEPWLPAMIEQLLYASPASTRAIERLCETLSEIATAWPRGRALRILEIGAGGATPRILNQLSRSGTPISYLATSPDPEAAARLGYAAASVDGAAAQCWSPHFAEQDLEGRRFDIVLAINAGARMQLDATSLSRLRDMLAPGGIFLAAEPEPNPLWDLVFGRQPEWRRGGALPAHDSPLRSGEEWCSELSLAGFSSPAMVRAAAAPWPIILLFGTVPLVPAATAAMPAAPLSVMLVGDHAAALADNLAGAFPRVMAAEAGSPASLAGGNPQEDLASVFVFLVAEPADPEAVEGCARAIANLAQLALQAAECGAALWVVTRGAQQPPNRGRAGLTGAALWGFARVLVNELARFPLRLLDLPPEADLAETAALVAAELAAAGAETEIVWTPEGRHVLRLRRGLPARWATPTEPLCLSTAQPGSIDALNWRLSPPRSPGAGEVDIAVEAAGLNFRDLMWAMGLLPEEALIDGFAGPGFGLECAGTVRAVGPGVEGIAVGDRVAGLAPAALANRVVTTAQAVMKLPPELPPEAAATIPVAFVTAIYALRHMARIAPGEYVLIHAAAGGVGLAAIQYARHCGAAVIATAGSEAKRAFLRLAGADHVLDSRDLFFPDRVRQITGGQGVDIVLNSLSGEAMEHSLSLLKPFGRFLELGKRDFYLNRQIHLRPLRQNISYFAIDVDQLPTRRPDLARALLAEVSQALAAGAVRPLAHRVFRFAEIDDAFRLMQASSHIGKLVLVPAGNAGVRRAEPPEARLRRDGTYLVTGGLGGFGYEAARWLAAHGAGAIALLGRRGSDTPDAAERVAALAAAGAEVSVYAGDVGDPASLAEILATIRACQPPLRGVVHAASAIGDGLATDLDAARIAPLLHAKLGGAILLDRLTRGDPIELFLLFSSATTILGAPGQGVYVAANSAIEALARERRAAGRPALAVAWGPIEDAGYLAERKDTREGLARRLGAKPLPAARALDCLPALMASGLPVAAIVEASWNEARRYLPILTAPLFDDVRAAATAAPSDDSLAERLAGMDGDEALELLKTVVTEEAATILRLPSSSLDPLRPLSDVGMDSLMAVELRLALEARLRVDLPLVSLAEGTSIASIAARLASAASGPPQAPDLIEMAARYESPNAIELAEVIAVEERAPADAMSHAAK